MKVVRLKPLLLAIFIIIIFCPYVLFCILFVLFCFLSFFLGGGERKHFLHKRFDRTITVAFHVIGLFCFCFLFPFLFFQAFYVATLK